MTERRGKGRDHVRFMRHRDRGDLYVVPSDAAPLVASGTVGPAAVQRVQNRAPAGRPFAIPVYVQRQAGAEFGALRDLRVEASYDDGATWRAVPVAGSGLERVALLQHPHGAGYVSLKASAVDSAGNKVEQTIIRAYALK
ncbi:hypothetical protein ACFQ1L_25860 [Phytohabitans flavus]|uniref:hypothetical protein n=1 Tax=Phytohabitans flavus TaxID=1076124 RepID=UPI0018D95996|nr:hypothetical protein [Phytohabitans flavus]